MNLVDRLISKHFQSRNGELWIDDVAIHSLAGRYGTPLFVYATSVMERCWRQLRQALPKEFDLFYSIKANPNPSILKFFLSKGIGLEVASGGEYYQAIQSGCHPDNIIFAGPGKTEAELAYVLEKGVGELHVESPLEGSRLEVLARSLHVKPTIAVRVNPAGEAEGGAMRMGGRPAPFGVDEETALQLAKELENRGNVEVAGIHLFTGTQILDHEILLRQYRQGIEIGRRLARDLGRPLRTVDFGGGLGIPYFSNESDLDLASFGAGLKRLVAETRSDPWFSGTRFLIEPGRFLVGEAGIYVTRVNDIKVSRGTKFVVSDGGMNHHLAASGNLGQVIKRNFPVAVLNKLGANVEEQVDVVGPLCTPLDVLLRKTDLPRLEVGDLLGVFQSGAYARTASPLGFLSHPTPPEVLVRDGTDYLIRRRGKYDDLLVDCPNLDVSMSHAIGGIESP